MRGKKGISEVISTVLIILLTIAAVSILSAVVISFVKDQLSAKDCLEAIDKLLIEDGKFTCHNSTNTLIMVSRSSDSEFKLKGLVISLKQNTGTSKVYNLQNGSPVEEIRMYDGTQEIRIPGAGGAETYVFSISSDYVRVAPILESGKTCKEVNKNLNQC
jgi:hypothetical protein